MCWTLGKHLLLSSIKGLIIFIDLIEVSFCAVHKHRCIKIISLLKKLCICAAAAFM